MNFWIENSPLPSPLELFRKFICFGGATLADDNGMCLKSLRDIRLCQPLGFPPKIFSAKGAGEYPQFLQIVPTKKTGLFVRRTLFLSIFDLFLIQFGPYKNNISCPWG